MKNTVIILAAGSGRRMGCATPKQFLELEGFPLIYYTISQFEKHPHIHEIILVTQEENISFCKEEIVAKYKFKKVKKVIRGGTERYESVYNGLLACEDTDYVLVHDGARPFISKEIITKCIKEVTVCSACIVAVPTKDTIKITDANGFVSHTPNRKYLWNVQTPQVFSYELLRESYDRILKLDCSSITDDAMVVEAGNLSKIKVVEGEYCNIKVTTKEDLALAKNFLKKLFKMG